MLKRVVGSNKRVVRACSFCEKDEKLARRLIAGPGVFISDECVALCNSIL